MAKDPIYLAFSTQKGGAGKTTLTVLVASYLHKEQTSIFGGCHFLRKKTSSL